MPQMGDCDDKLSFFQQFRYELLRLFDGISKVKLFDVFRGSLYCSIRCGQTESRAFCAVGQSEADKRSGQMLTGLLHVDVRGEDREPRQCMQLLEVVKAEVKLVIAHAHGIKIHQIECQYIRLALVDGGKRGALQYVTSDKHKSTGIMSIVPITYLLYCSGDT